MLASLGNHFNISLLKEERKAILKGCPKPSCDALQVPQSWTSEHDPHYGSEKTMFRLQELLTLLGFRGKSYLIPSQKRDGKLTGRAM